MEIDSIEENGHNTVLIESLSPDNSLPTKSGIHGDPEILPRVGDQFQAEIPQLLTLSDHLNLSNDKEQEQITETGSIPLIWISEEVPEKSRDEGGQWSKGHRLVPGRSGGVWSELEESGFVLGLYVFGKNLCLVKRLVGSKEMGDVLAYYYGDFLGSERYKRWSECRKMKNKKCIYGPRIFTGSRHQEFLSRLLVGASVECRNSLVEMFKAFGEGKLTLEDYFFGLKSELGLKPLIEAMSIGRGKRDLTGNVAGNHSLRREPPAGKPLAALSPAEIISVLTGDSRLSKAKASDLFWDSVWPRLLARGWHSEQPSSAATGLVYIAPGIDTFSRSELVRGVDFFDSVSDVLDLVASRPELLEIDDVVADVGDEVSRRCYLRPPPTPVRGTRFTVVDTCARDDRELRCLPAKALDDNYENGDNDEKDDSLEIFEAVPSDGRKRRRRRRESPSDGSALLALPAYPVSSGAKARRRRKRSSPQSSRHVAFIYGIDPNDKLSSSASSASGSSEAVDLDADAAAEEQHRTVQIDEVVVVGSTEDGTVEEVELSSLLLPPPEEVPSVGPAAEEAAEKMNPVSAVAGPADEEVKKKKKRKRKNSSFSIAGPAAEEAKKSSFSVAVGPAAEGAKGEDPVSVVVGPTDEVSVVVGPAAEGAKGEDPVSVVVGPTDEVSVVVGPAAEGAKKEDPVSFVVGPAEEEWAGGPPRRRQGTRNRPLTTRVLEAFAYGYMDAKHNNNNNNNNNSSKKNKRPRASSSESSRRVRLKESVGPDPATVAFESTVQNGGSGGDVFNKFGQ